MAPQPVVALGGVCLDAHFGGSNSVPGSLRLWSQSARLHPQDPGDQRGRAASGHHIAGAGLERKLSLPTQACGVFLLVWEGAPSRCIYHQERVFTVKEESVRCAAVCAVPWPG